MVLAESGHGGDNLSMANIRVLLLHEVGNEVPQLRVCESHELRYRFTATPPADGFSAWKIGSAGGSDLLEVAQSCERFPGGYAQHALNRLFSQTLLRLRPDVVVIGGLNGCTADLPRVAALLGVPTVLLLDAPSENPDDLPEDTGRWLRASLTACYAIIPRSAQAAELWPDAWLSETALRAADVDLDALLAPLLSEGAVVPPAYDYSLYEFCQRDHPLLVAMQAGDTRHFQGCNSVLDLACGVGIFLDCLRREGIVARGVERDERIASYARGMGLDVETGDALEYLERASGAFDGVYCSHFVEHLPVDDVQALLHYFYRTLAPGGVLVLVFPDPESIRSQLLGFWRDPEHVRFYHPELIATMATAAGLELEWSSYDEQPHKVVSFNEDPPALPEVLPRSGELKVAQKGSEGVMARFLKLLGIAPASHLAQLEERLGRWSETLRLESERQQAVNRVLEERTAKLWDVNGTWAWNDNATLRLRKPAR